MNQVIVNYWSVLGAAIASMVFGSLYYGPLFGKQWMKLMGFSEEKIEEMKKDGGGSKMYKLYLIAFIGSLVTGYVLTHFIVFTGAFTSASGAYLAFLTAFWAWLGFHVPLSLGSVLWEGKSWSLWLFNNAYNLTNLVLMSLILTW